MLNLRPWFSISFHLRKRNSRRILLDKIEAQLSGARTAAEQEIAKIRRQKRKRSRRAKLKLLADKRHQAEKKSLRGAVRLDHDD